MKDVVKGSAFLGFVFVVFSMGCSGSHRTSNAQGVLTQAPQQSTAPENGFVGPDATLHDAQGNQAGAASQDASNGTLGTPLQSQLEAVNKPPTAFTSISDSDLIDLPQDIKSGVNVNHIRELIFNQINQERKTAGLPPVGYDKVGELAASIHVLEQVQAKSWLSHYSLNGDLPYMRYSQADGYNFIEENAAVWQGNIDKSTPRPASADGCRSQTIFPVPAAGNIEEMGSSVTSSLECAMVNEKAPEDGHRQTILNPHATGVGISIGMTVGHDQFGSTQDSRIIVFLVEEFETQGLATVNPWPLTVKNSQNESIDFSGSLQDGLSFDHALLFYEVPQVKTVQQAASVNHYGFPEKYTVMIPRLPPGVTRPFKNRQTGEIIPSQARSTVNGQAFSIPVTLDKGLGVYTLSVYATKKGDKTPFPVSSRSLYVLP